MPLPDQYWSSIESDDPEGAFQSSGDRCSSGRIASPEWREATRIDCLASTLSVQKLSDSSRRDERLVSKLGGVKTSNSVIADTESRHSIKASLKSAFLLFATSHHDHCYFLPHHALQEFDTLRPKRQRQIGQGYRR